MRPLVPSAITADGGGTSSAGLELKKPSGLSMKPTEVTGITGQSSIRGTCVWPKLYQTTTSVEARSRSAFVHAPSPVSAVLWFGYSPAG